MKIYNLKSIFSKFEKSKVLRDMIYRVFNLSEKVTMILQLYAENTVEKSKIDVHSSLNTGNIFRHPK